MHRTTGAGNVAGAFVDEVPSVTTGTTVEKAWLNTLQEELVNLVEAAGLTLSTPDDDQAKEATEKLIAERGKILGEMFFLDSYRAPSAWNRAAPLGYFAGVSLNTGDQDLDVSDWPDLVPHLLARFLTYLEGTGSSKLAFDVTDWVVATNVATLTFANTSAELAAITAMVEDNLVHGSFSSWRAITLDSPIGNIPAGTYAITALDAVARTVTFSVTASDGSGSVTATAKFPLHAIEGSSDARVFERVAGVFESANDADGEAMAGLRRRDRLQGHSFGRIASETLRERTDVTAGAASKATLSDTSGSQLILTDDGTNGTPRTGPTTDPRAIVGHMYLWAIRYTP